MKKLISLLILVIMLMTCASSYAAGMDIVSEKGDRIGILEDITVEDATSGDVVVVLGDIVINSNVNGDVVAILGDVTINSEVSGEVVSVLGKISLTDDAVIKGNIVSVGSVEKDEGAQVYGEEIKVRAGEFDTGFLLVAFVVTVIILSIITLLSGLILIALLKDKFTKTLDNIEYKIGRKIATGFLGLLAVTIALLILLVTVIAPIAYLGLMIGASVASSIYFGRVLLKTFGTNNNIYLEFITGLITITLIKVLLIYLVPHYNFVLGSIIYVVFSILVASLGIGILIDTKIYKNVKNI